MFVGHYGVGFAAKKIAPTVPLWLFFIAVQLLDVAWAPLVLAGIEKVRIVPGITATNPLDLYYMPYTHSLVAALVWSLVALVIYRLWKGRESGRAAVVVAIAVFSHWVLDLIVHRPDLSLYDDTAKMGLGLWNFLAAALGLEIALLFGGMLAYFSIGARHRVATAVFGLIMVAIQAYVFFGPPPVSGKAAAVTAIVAYVLFAAVIRLLEGPARITLGTD